MLRSPMRPPHRILPTSPLVRSSSRYTATTPNRGSPLRLTSRLGTPSKAETGTTAEFEARPATPTALRTEDSILPPSSFHRMNGVHSGGEEDDPLPMLPATPTGSPRPQGW